MIPYGRVLVDVALEIRGSIAVDLTVKVDRLWLAISGLARFGALSREIGADVVLYFLVIERDLAFVADGDHKVDVR